MTVKRILFNLLGLCALLLIIYYGGNYLSNHTDKVFRRTVDKYGIVVKAVVTNKAYLKGYYVHFSYDYMGVKYLSNEQSRNYYDNLNINDEIEIKIDTTKPEDAYIFAIGNE